MRIGEFYDGRYLVCWTEAEIFKPKDMTEVIAHRRDVGYDDCSSDYVIGYYHENGDYISDGMRHVDFGKMDYYMRIPPLPWRNEQQ